MGFAQGPHCQEEMAAPNLAALTQPPPPSLSPALLTRAAEPARSAFTDVLAPLPLLPW
jgi:hypothetical protein